MKIRVYPKSTSRSLPKMRPSRVKKKPSLVEKKPSRVEKKPSLVKKKPPRVEIRPTPDSEEGWEWLARVRRHYDEVVRKTEGFDTCGLPTPTRFGGLRQHKITRSNPCPGLVLLYARLGLHRYNMLQGKNLQLSSVKKFNQSTHTIPGTYYITLEAKDPEFGSLLTFQAKVCETGYNRFLLFCDIARPLGETKRSDIGEIKGYATNPKFLITDLMPELPSENSFKRFYVLKDSEVEDNDNDWVRLYLELAVATTNRRSKDLDLSKLKILKVAIEPTQDHEHEPLLSAYDATLYIRFKDSSCEGKDVDRVAIVRRVLHEETYIVGRIESSENMLRDD